MAEHDGKMKRLRRELGKALVLQAVSILLLIVVSCLRKYWLILHFPIWEGIDPKLRIAIMACLAGYAVGVLRAIWKLMEVPIVQPLFRYYIIGFLPLLVLSSFPPITSYALFFMPCYSIVPLLFICRRLDREAEHASFSDQQSDGNGHPKTNDLQQEGRFD